MNIVRRPKPRQPRQPATPPPPQQRLVTLREEYITLGQLLKVAGVIGSGGEAKTYLAATAVLVNGEPEQRRGRKLRPGDVIAPPGEDSIVLQAAAETDAIEEEA
jgi:ribosome-associated protein